SCLTYSSNSGSSSDTSVPRIDAFSESASAVKCGAVRQPVARHARPVDEGRVDGQCGTDTHTTAEAFAALADNDEAWTVSAYDPAYTSATTPEEMTRFLSLLWRGDVLSTASTEFARAVMSRQIWPHRIAAAFPHRGVVVAGKTGTIGVIRNEVAVVEFPGETPVAVAVFTRAARADPTLPVVDAAIGEAARLAVTELRRPH
ncbi:serine hydrolase, partial [Gordonia aichiensis]